ncbi:hypothetical protein E4U55_005452 [Claviceps digitariae]|nr:hypothetical protein E4U55_005452 [Claviceps digitariae]
MEAAAKTVEVLSKRMLPEKPHHLSFSPTWRHRSHPEDDETTVDFRVARRRFEEWHCTRLQYLTFLSEADRGTLLTRSYYDMREEPSKPLPREVSALSKGISTGEKKKLSLSDYKNKKTALVASASPSEAVIIAKRKESERAVPPHCSATPTPPTSHIDGGRPYQDPRRSEPIRSDGPSRARELDAFSASAKAKPTRDGVVTAVASESRLPPKPASLPPRPPSPAGKRRGPDDDEQRPQKRSRPDDRRLWDDRMQRDRDDVSRRRDKVLPPSRDRDHRDTAGNVSLRDDRGNPSSSLPNGRSLLKGPTNAGRNSPPAGRSRGDSVNGLRPTLAGNSSSRVTPTKPDAAGTKSFVPPLLSPLQLNFDSQEKEKRLRAEEIDTSARKDKERRRRDETNEESASSKPRKLESTTSSTAAKKSRSNTFVSIPPLLSPTLPPTIEAELQRQKKAASDSSEERIRDGRDAPGVKKRPAAGKDVDEDVTHVSAPVKKLGHRRRLLVVLSVPKSLQSAFASIVGHTSEEHKKESHRQSSDRELERKPLAGRDDVTHQAPARKRPVDPADGLSAAEGNATKRPRSSDLSVNPKLGAPLTPSRKATAMSRVSSTNSLAQTPTGLASSTPLAPVPMSASASADRRTNGHEIVFGNRERTEVRLLQKKEATFMAVGKKLKHEADPILQQYRSDGVVSLDRASEFKLKLAYVLGLESTIAFLMAFHSQNVYRAMYNKAGDLQSWKTMLPLLDGLLGEMKRNDVRNQQPLYAMLLMFFGVSIDEVLKCYVHQPETPESPRSALGYVTYMERRKFRMLLQAQQANAAVQNPKVRVDVHPWSTLDDIADASLRALRAYCAEEDIDWAPDQIIRDNLPVNPNPVYPRR